MKFRPMSWILLLSLLFLAACQGDDPPTDEATPQVTTESSPESSADSSGAEVSDNNEQTIITFAVSDFEEGLYNSRIEAFESANPDIKIELVSLNEITGQAFFGESALDDETALKLVQAADVIATNPTGQLIDHGFLLDLAPLLANDTQISVDDFYPGLLNSYQRSGGLWGVPLTASYGVIVYDKGMFDAAGIAYPEVGWSWTDFLSAAQTLTRQGEGEAQWGFDPGFGFALPFIEAKAGIPLVNYQTSPPEVNLTAPESIAAFRWYQELAQTHKVMSADQELTGDTVIVGGFGLDGEANNVAMRLENSEFIDADVLESANLGVVPFPVDSTEDNSSPISNQFGLNNGLVISAGTAKVDAAWSWIKFLSGQATDTPFFGGSSLPALRSTAVASGFWDNLNVEMRQALEYATEHAFVPSELPGDQLQFTLADRIRYSENDPDSELASIQTQVEEALQKEQADLAAATPVPEIIVAEPPSSQISEDATQIRFVTLGGDTTTFRNLAEQFTEENPEIVVKVSEPNFFSEAPTLSSMVADADCFQSFGNLNNPEDRAAILSLQPFIDADPDLNESDFYPTVLDSFRHQGELQGLPNDVLVKIMAYDKRKFDAAGIPYPTNDWTPEQFLEAAVALTSGEGENRIYAFTPSFDESSDLVYMMGLLGANFIDDSSDPANFTLEDPETIAAMRWYANLTTEFEVKPPPSSDPFGSFAIDPSGESASAIWVESNFGGFFVGGEGLENDTDHIGYVLFPSNGAGSNYESANGLFISAETQHRQECWEWLKFLSQSAGAAQFGLPAHIETAESQAFEQQVGAEKAETLRTAVAESQNSSEYSQFLAGDNWISLIVLWLDEAHRQITLENVSVEEAMAQAQANAEAYRACIIENDSFTDFEKMYNCATEVDPDLFR